MLRFIVLFAAAATASVASAQPPPSIRVVQQNGRALQGELDARTDQQSLWLLRRRGSVAISVAIPWTSVESGSIDGRTLRLKKLRATALRKRPERTTSYLDLPPNSRPQTTPGSDPPAPQHPASAAPKAVELRIAARAANWDADIPRDGVIVELELRDSGDRFVAHSGVLRAELWSIRKPHPARSASWTRIGRWSQFVRRDQFVTGQARLRLPYRGDNPEVDGGYFANAILHVVFQPTRQGSLEASATLRLHESNYLRDALEATAGSRFLPQERIR